MSMYHDIIRAPLITEKNTTLQHTENKYVFEVRPNATKPQIKRAVEKLFEVDVASVNTLLLKGKKKRMGRHIGKRPDRKKAVVKLAAGQSIPQFAEV